MNDRDQITVIESKMASVQERRRIMVEADTAALRCFNDTMIEADCDDVIEDFAESLKKLRNGT